VRGRGRCCDEGSLCCGDEGLLVDYESKAAGRLSVEQTEQPISCSVALSLLMMLARYTCAHHLFRPNSSIPCSYLECFAVVTETVLRVNDGQFAVEGTRAMEHRVRQSVSSQASHPARKLSGGSKRRTPSAHANASLRVLHHPPTSTRPHLPAGTAQRPNCWAPCCCS